MFTVFAVSYGKTLNTADGAVSLAAAPFSFAEADVARATRARISVTSQALRVALGTSTGATDGVYYAADSVIIVEGANNIRTMTLRAMANGAVVNVELEV